MTCAPATNGMIFVKSLITPETFN